MRAMILAAGLGTRLRPLSLLRPKPAMPVQGRPVIAYLLELLVHAGVTEVMVNRYHLPEELERAVAEHCPAGLSVVYSDEDAPLGTGGGIRRAADFLRESDPCIVLAGDMLLDLDIASLVAQHRARRNSCTLVLRSDPRLADFGSIGLDADDRLCRIATRFDLGGFRPMSSTACRSAPKPMPSRISLTGSVPWRLRRRIIMRSVGSSSLPRIASGNPSAPRRNISKST